MRFILLLVILGFVSYTSVSARPQDVQESEIVANPESYSLSEEANDSKYDLTEGDEDDTDDELAADEQEDEELPADEQEDDEEEEEESAAEEGEDEEEPTDDELAEEEQVEQKLADEKVDIQSVPKPIATENALESLIDRIRNFFGNSDKKQ